MSAWSSKYGLLVRREFWENKSLWLAPGVVALLLLVLPMFGNFHFGAGGIDVSSHMPPELRPRVGEILLASIAGILSVIACIVTLIYLLDCLYAERRDRSILFWKSLPVSDAETVITKLLTALVLMPVLTLLLALLVYVMLTGLAYLRYEALRPALDLASFGGAFAELPQMAGGLLFLMLWYAPVAAYLMLASVLAKRSPMVYAVLPPVVLILLEQMVFGSAHVARFLGRWLFPWARMELPVAEAGGRVTFDTTMDWTALWRGPELWLGLAVAAGMVYIVIRLRRYRDDT